MTRPDQPRRPVTLLFVCTGNICRSPVAERLAAAMLDGVGAAGTAVRVGSAGIRAVVGSGMHPDSARALQGYGVDAGGFTARQLDDSVVAATDLVLTMTRGHRQHVLEGSPRAMNRTFTLREAVGLLQVADTDLPASAGPGGDPVQAWVQQLSRARSRLRGGREHDIDDPVGGPYEAHERAAAAIADALGPLLAGLARTMGATTSPIHRSPVAR